MDNKFKNQLLQISQMAGMLCLQAETENEEVYHVARHIQLAVHNYLEEDGSMVFKGGEQ